MADSAKIKVKEPETIKDIELPTIPQWEGIANRPTKLSDLDQQAQDDIDDLESTFLTLGDLAYLNSITTTEITDDAVTTPKIFAGAVTAAKISVGELSAISANIGDITAGTITGVLFKTADTGERIEIDTTNVNQIRFYDGSTLYGFIEADRVGSDGYINLKTDDGNGIQLDTGIGASGFNAVSMFANGGTFSTSGNASSGFIGMYADGSNEYLHIARSAGSYELVTDLDFLPEFNGTQDLGSASKTWSRVYVDDGIELNGVEINDWTDIGGGGADTDLGNLTATSINRDLDPDTTLTRDLGSTTRRWDRVYADVLNLDGGGYIDEVRAIYFEQGRTTNPSIEGEIRFYDGGSVNMRVYLAGDVWNFDLTAA